MVKDGRTRQNTSVSFHEDFRYQNYSLLGACENEMLMENFENSFQPNKASVHSLQSPPKMAKIPKCAISPHILLSIGTLPKVAHLFHV